MMGLPKYTNNGNLGGGKGRGVRMVIGSYFDTMTVPPPDGVASFELI